MSPREFLKAVPPGMAITVAVVFVILNGLGVWQLERLRWKQGLMAEMVRTQALAPVPAEGVLAEPKPDWRSVTLPACEIRSDTLIYMHADVEGTPGYRALAACPLTGKAMLVDLGFVVDRLALAAPVKLEPVGRLRPYEKAGRFTVVNRVAENDWYWRSATEMGPALKADLRGDYFLILDVTATGANLPGLTQAPMVAPLTNRHLEYALTWFGLAWTLLAVFAGVVWSRAKKTKAA